MVRAILFAASMFTVVTGLQAQTAPVASASTDAELKFVVYLSRHGIRSPTGDVTQYDRYSAAPWPAWDVPPGYLTEHGFTVMKLFGAYDRAYLAQEGLLSAQGCGDAEKVAFYADSDQRTRETAKALAEGMFPGCAFRIAGNAEGARDPLFHHVSTDSALANNAAASINGRIGNDAGNVTEAYRSELASFDHLLATCGAPANAHQRTSLFDVPATLSPGQGDHAAELRGPLSTASTLAENLLLEYAEGWSENKVGWGCADGNTIRSLIGLHAAATDFSQRTPEIARGQVSGLLMQVNNALEQAVRQRPVADVLDKPTDRALFLIGHDTNLENLAGLLNLTWISDGRRDDTPPGSALVFELWYVRATRSYEVKVFYTAQTLEQMRFAQPLGLDHPPQRVPIFLPGCSRSDFSCTWSAFSELLHRVTRATGATPEQFATIQSKP